jgi:hypothetical protein
MSMPFVTRPSYQMTPPLHQPSESAGFSHTGRARNDRDLT